MPALLGLSPPMLSNLALSWGVNGAYERYKQLCLSRAQIEIICYMASRLAYVIAVPLPDVAEGGFSGR